MQNQWKFMMGIDISKKTFDISVGINEPKVTVSKASFSNSLKGYDKLSTWLEKKQIKFSETLVCLENTGIYHRLLVQFLQNKNVFVWVETPVQIKWSMGIQRGKSDSVDAERIMTYAFRNQDKAIAHQSQDKALQQVADYLSLRSRLQKCIQTLKKPIKELKSIGLIKDAEALEKACKQSIETLKNELKSLDQKIKATIKKDEELNKKYKLAISVKCVGFVAASHLLVYTHGFTRFATFKQLASYAGIAPFEHQSGTSIKGRTKVHPMANKKLKTILHMCAVSAVRHNPELKVYFARSGKEKTK